MQPSQTKTVPRGIRSRQSGNFHWKYVWRRAGVVSPVPVDRVDRARIGPSAPRGTEDGSTPSASGTIAASRRRPPAGRRGAPSGIALSHRRAGTERRTGSPPGGGGPGSRGDRGVDADEREGQQDPGFCLRRATARDRTPTLVLAWCSLGARWCFLVFIGVRLVLVGALGVWCR